MNQIFNGILNDATFFSSNWWQGTLPPPHPTEGWLRKGKGNNTLFVILHGINEKEMTFRIYLSHICAGIPDRVDVYAPMIKQHHNGRLFSYSSKVLEEVGRWKEEHRDGNIVLLGLSNGGRIASYIESRLDEPRVDKIKVITVGSPLKGTDVLNYIPSYIAKMKVGVHAYDEFYTGFSYYKEGERYVHFASSTDQFVFPVSKTSFEKESIVLDGYGHTSLPFASEIKDIIMDSLTYYSMNFLSGGIFLK